jgi:Arabinose-binding domain of AraC transcription regulator, N-term
MPAIHLLHRAAGISLVSSGCSDASVAAGFARGLIDFAASQGADPEALAARAGIAPAALARQDNRIPFASYVALMRAARALTGDPAFALHFGEAVDIRDLSIVALLSQGCGTMMEAFAQTSRYARLDIDLGMGAVDRLQLRRRGGRLWLVDGRPNPNDFPELTESAFARMASSIAGSAPRRCCARSTSAMRRRPGAPNMTGFSACRSSSTAAGTRSRSTRR